MGKILSVMFQWVLNHHLTLHQALILGEEVLVEIELIGVLNEQLILGKIEIQNSQNNENPIKSQCLKKKKKT